MIVNLNNSYETNYIIPLFSPISTVMKLTIFGQQFETKSEIRAACTQVLFSAVYHLRSAVLPYASDLLRMALKALRKESDKVNYLCSSTLIIPYM